MKKLSLFIVIGLLFIQMVYSQNSPKRELRSNWLTTVWRLDWPTVTVPANGTSTQRQAAINTQKNDLLKILDRMKGANMNTLFFQVRSMSDAMYQSSYENWSMYISSERGADPGWDPLAFAVVEAHKRGMELHAWLNPYRYSTSTDNHGNLPNDYAVEHPEWLIAYDSNFKILNPGLPAVTQRISDIVAEIVTNYDVDGIVFDDYFYGNGVTNNTHDQEQYDLYNPDGLSRGDWRRENCNKMIKAVYDRIQTLKPYVTFGVSPAGVAASSAAVASKYGVPPAPVGSDWQYNGIYADPLAWLQQGSVDYISPQIYWEINSGQPYDKLAVWWSMVANKFSKHFYSSHSLSAMTGGGSTGTPFPAPSKMKEAASVIVFQNETIPEAGLSGIEKRILSDYPVVENSTSTMQKAPTAVNFGISEVGLQVAANRTSDLNGAPGSVFYRNINTMGVTFLNYMKSEVFTRPAIQPSLNWKKALDQSLVENLAVNENTLSWTHDKTDIKYAVYAVPIANSNASGLYSTSDYLVDISYGKQYVLPIGVSTATHKIAVSALDRYRNETGVRVLGEAAATPVAAQLTYPENNSSPIIPTIFKWNPVVGADSYVWEVATDAQFTNLICARETAVNQFFSGLQTNIVENQIYYWRVKTRKANAQDIYSEAFKFGGVGFSITFPANGATGVSVTPTIQWMNVSSTAQYTLEIATSALFPVSSIVFTQSVNSTSLTVPEHTLLSETTYFARIKVSDGNVQATSEAISFKTVDMVIPIPTILSPADGTEVAGKILQITWAEQNSKGFRAELSQSNIFPPRSTTVNRVDAFVYNTAYTNLNEGVYYIQLKAQNNTGLTDASPYITVTMKAATDVSNVYKDSWIKSYLDKNNRLHLELSETTNGNTSAAIYSISGALVYTSALSPADESNKYTIDMQGYPRGVYVVKVSTGENQGIVKISL